MVAAVALESRLSKSFSIFPPRVVESTDFVAPPVHVSVPCLSKFAPEMSATTDLAPYSSPLIIPADFECKQAARHPAVSRRRRREERGEARLTLNFTPGLFARCRRRQR